MKKLKIRNIIRNKKARTVPIIAIIVIILIIAGIAVYFIYDIISDSDNYWETPNEFGVLGLEILLMYEDGTVQSVKSLAEDELLSVYHSGKKVIGYQYKIKGKASGAGWDNVEVDFTEYNIMVSSKSASGIIYNSHSHSFVTMTSFSVDDQWHSLCSVSGGITNIFTDDMPLGIYTMTFASNGRIKYKGNPGGNWETGTSPASISLTMEVKSDQGVLSVAFVGEATTI